MDTFNCECDFPGFCKRHRVVKDERDHSICQGNCPIKAKLRHSYIQAWENFKHPKQPKVDIKEIKKERNKLNSVIIHNKHEEIVESNMLFYEDFCPISNREALVVGGESYPELSTIFKVTYRREKTGVITFIPKSIVFSSDQYVRLGTLYDDTLCYSEGAYVYLKGLTSLTTTKLFRGIQPYLFRLNSTQCVAYQYLSDIYFDEEIILGMEEVGCIEMGRPCINNGIMYFEARFSEAPVGWVLFSFNLNTGHLVKLFPGANPYVFNNILYHSVWNMYRGKFDIKWQKL